MKRQSEKTEAARLSPQYKKRCGDCGVFLARERWTIVDAPHNPTPMCDRCLSQYISFEELS